MVAKPPLPLHIRLVIGTPVRYVGYRSHDGHLVAPIREYLDQIGRIWLDQGLLDVEWRDFQPNTLRSYIVAFQDAQGTDHPVVLLDNEIEPLD